MLLLLLHFLGSLLPLEEPHATAIHPPKQQLLLVRALLLLQQQQQG
jgi:hypothetical protein